MNRKFLGLFIALMILAFIGCQNSTTDTPTTTPSDTPTTTPTDTPTTTPAVITLLVIPGVVAPVQGATSVTTVIDTAQYSGTIVWSPTASAFAPITVYTANIALTAKAGWTLTGVAANGFSVAGATATNAASSGNVTAVYPTTFAAPILTMVSVPTGSFQRDATATNISVITSAFKMSEKEITRAQFAAVMGTDPSDVYYSSGTTDPVQMISWYHAIAFCNKLSIAEGLTPVYSVTGVDFATLTYDAVPTKTSDAKWDAVTVTWTNNGYRLPTEMEWMWAAMGAPPADLGKGTSTTGYTKGYAGSSEAAGKQVNIGDYAWYVTNSDASTHPVGTKKANELGLYDMSGNVWEWCWDWADITTFPNYSITGTVTSDSAAGRGADSGATRVLRGGYWNGAASYCSLTQRGGNLQYAQGSLFGFRVVRL